MTHAEKREDLDAMIEDAKRAYIEGSLKYGGPIANPESTHA